MHSVKFSRRLVVSSLDKVTIKLFTILDPLAAKNFKSICLVRIIFRNKSVCWNLVLILCFPGFTVLHRLIVFAPKNSLVLQSYFLSGHVIKRCSSFIWVLKFDAAFFSCLSKFFEQVFVRIIQEPVLKFTKVTTSLLQFNVSSLFLMRIEILIDFALVHLAYVARQDVLGQVSKT